MPDARKIKMIIKAKPVMEGAGVRLKRALGFSRDNPADPFLLLDHFRSNSPADYLAGFPWHPHRGIETITYMLEGEVEHGDSMGNKGVIKAGDVQWMTAGSGIIHQEMPKGGKGGVMHGFQLWANLPAVNKMMDPRYREVKSADIPIVKQGGAVIRVVAGKVAGKEGPVKDVVTGPEYFDVTLEAETVYECAVKPGHCAFAYVIDGRADFGELAPDFTGEPERYYSGKPMEKFAKEEHMIIYADGAGIKVHSGTEGVRFLLISGRPLNEPVAWYGPIVMNTEEELSAAFEEYENGTFLKSHKPTT